MSDTSDDLFRQGDLSYWRCEYKKAREHFQSILNRLSVSPRQLARCYNSLGATNAKLQNYEEAFNNYRQQLDILLKLKTSKEITTDVVKCYTAIGKIFCFGQDYVAAIDYYKQAIDLLSTTTATSDLVSNIYKDLANIYTKALEFHLATEYFTKALEIDQQQLPRDHPKFGQTYANMGAMYYRQEKYEEALHYFSKAREIWQRSLPSSHIYIESMGQTIGEVQTKLDLLKRTSVAKSKEFKSNGMETFIDYLLDTKNTSDVSFNQAIQTKSELADQQNKSNLEKIVNEKLQQQNDFYPEESDVLRDRLTLNSGKEIAEDSSDHDEVEEDSSSEEDKLDSTVQKNEQIIYPISKLKSYIDRISQCKRLLQLLYYWQEKYSHLSDIYFDMLDRCLKSANERLSTVALEQVVFHLSDDRKQDEHLRKLLPADFSSPNIPDSHKPILTLIQTLLSIKQDQILFFSPDQLDISYPSTARFLDVQRAFRDSSHYFIDGDSLILSVVHHINLNLLSYFGNTLHVIFIIERILLTLFNQAYQCNYTVVFFDCHFQYYQQEKSILHLLRASLVNHLSKNTTQVKVQQFSSWTSDNYVRYAQEKKPHFIFYHDLSSLNVQSNQVVSEKTLTKLLHIYRLFGNYHQYNLQCHLYLMNKLVLTDTTVQCFEVKFNTQCPKNSIQQINEKNVSIPSRETTIEDENWLHLEKLICKEIDQKDVRLFIYLRTIAECLKNNETLLDLISPLLILHVTLLLRLSLIDRHLPVNIPAIKFSPTLTEFINQFQRHLAINQSLHYSSDLSWLKIADLFDGRLFAFTLYQLNSSTSKVYFDTDTVEIVHKSLSLLKLPNNKNLFHDVVQQLVQSEHLIIPSASWGVESNPTRSQKITRIINPFIDTLLKPILTNHTPQTFDFIDPDDRSSSRYEDISLDSDFPRERHYWHAYKEVGDEISRIRDNDIENRKYTSYHHRTRTNQKFYTYFNLYGKSLTSRDARDNQLQIVLPTPCAASTGANVSSNQRKKGKNNPPPKKADLIRKENEQEKLAKRMEEESKRLRNVENGLARIRTDDYAAAIDFLDKNLSDLEMPTSRLKILTRKFGMQRKYLQSLRRTNILSNEVQVGYFATMTELAHLEHIENPFEKNEKYMEELIGQSPLDLETWYRFQLDKINSRIPRRESGTPDSRVPDFVPDAWQVEFLDAVDRQQSIIIVAPTASGKTYASYYAMKKVLEDSESICVYVAPTKALVNQVAATIYSKFGPIFGIFTRDYRMNMKACRILVTVPQCMEILLLSPHHQKWCQRMKYAIFDEIHCMSGEQGAEVWERTMLLINCPMIGLSATVSNGEELCQWIEHVEQERSRLFQTPKSRPVRFIIHHERMADLNKYLYSNRTLHSLHPVGVMNGKQLVNRGVPKDLSLSPLETLRLKDATETTIPNDQTIPTLTEHFSPQWVVERSQCNEYSKVIRQRLDTLIEMNNTSAIDSIISKLQPDTTSYPETKPIKELVREFIFVLKEQNLLPCIVFCDKRSLCEEMAASMAQYLEEKEKDLRETTYKKKIEELTNRLELLEKTQKKIKTKKDRKSASRRNDDDNFEDLKMMEEEENSQRILSGVEYQLLYGILDEGTLANRSSCDRELTDTLLDRAEIGSPRLVQYMRRGVAYHHAGLNNKGRVAVEALFRNRYVQVVFSTSTLSLGIHMPTKTVAFVRDSIYLDALQYRQSSGRAGRRGFDVQGHVVFVDISMSKIQHLILSAIPNIHAHFPTSVTFFMRLLYLCSNAKDAKDAINRSFIALQCSFLAQSPMKRDLVNIQTRFHSLFTLDFLYRLNLIDGRGNLIGLAGLLSHLHYFEPANIILVYLMNTNLFRILKSPLEIMTVLAYLFTNLPWLITHHKYESMSDARRKAKLNSKLFLPTASEGCRKRIEIYNSIVKKVYGCYIETITRYLRSIDHQQKETLPFSNISFAQTSQDYDDGSFEYNLHHHQSQQEDNPSISPFAGPSGLTHENFMSNYNPSIGSWDLVYNLDLTSKVVPFVDIYSRDHTNTAYYLNSYALDFFQHGSETLLITENKLKSGDTYGLLLDFHLMLSSVRKSLEVILENDREEDKQDDSFIIEQLLYSIASVETIFSKNFRKQYPSRNQL